MACPTRWVLTNFAAGVHIRGRKLTGVEESVVQGVVAVASTVLITDTVVRSDGLRNFPGRVHYTPTEDKVRRSSDLHGNDKNSSFILGVGRDPGCGHSNTSFEVASPARWVLVNFASG